MNVFGYILANCKTLSEDEQKRFRALYCGMCKTLKARYGNLGRLTLGYDMTFLALTISALYEQNEIAGSERCALHPVKAHPFVTNEAMEYAADLNILLSYHKCRDNWQDDKNPLFAAGKLALESAYRSAKAKRPKQARAIQEWMDEIAEMERGGCMEIDRPVNSTGRMMGVLFQYGDDLWADDLYRMGDALGRFIYFMDAYDDLRSDVKRNRYNPLKSIMEQADFEAICKSSLSMMMADCADAFERLPILRDADLIRNILYSGVWSKYAYIQAIKQKKAEKAAAKEHQ